MDLEIFRAHARQHGFTLNNRFVVTIPIPQAVYKKLSANDASESDLQQLFKQGVRLVNILTGGSSTSQRGLQVMCSSAELPGLNIETSTSKQNGFRQTIATGSSKDTANFSFLLSADAYEKRILDAWRDYIVNNKTKKVAYYNSYVTEIEVITLDTAQNERFKVSLIEAWPSLFQKINLDKRQQTGLTSYSCTFTYKRFEDESEKKETSLLKNTTVGKIVEDVQNGNLEKAAYKSRKLIVAAKNGTLQSKQGQEAYNLLSNALNDTAGVSASDAERIAKTFKSDFAGSIDDPNDRTTLLTLCAQLGA